MICSSASVKLIWALSSGVSSTVNWIDTNKQGMTFGLLLAACVMTLLSLIKRRSFENVFANSALGALIGAPLGVCVNCVVPIARGMHSAGTRLETTLATMLAAVLVGAAGLQRLPRHFAGVERYAHALAGGTLAFCGAAIKFLGL